jgi:hypothetical protein
MLLNRVCLALTLVLTMMGCASLKKTPRPEKVEILLKGRPGESSETRYYSSSRTRTYSDSQLLRDKTESVDFLVRTDVTDYKPEQNILSYTVSTIRKDGPISLHDLAFPELDEKIDFSVRSDSGEVLKAGVYPSVGLFFVPSLPMPRRAVAVGDTWVLEHTWLSAQDQIPFRLEVIGILKGIDRCAKSEHLCADLELSGAVALAKVSFADGARFDSRISGRVMFDLDRGDVLWSEVHSQDDMIGSGEKTQVRSCMVSQLETGSDLKRPGTCEPR